MAGLGSTIQGQFASDIKSLEDVNYLLHKIAHAAAGCVAGVIQKSCEAGAIGAAVGEIVAYTIKTPETFNSLDELNKHQDYVRKMSQLVAGTVAAHAGYDDINVALVSAETAVRNNRQLNQFEKERLDLLAKGDGSKKARLEAAACAKIKCSAGLHPDSVEYAMAKKLEELGSNASYKVERDLLAKQKLTAINPRGLDTALFNYNGTYALGDDLSRFNAKYSITTRAGGAILTVGGVAGMIGSGLSVPTCVTAVGCVAVGAGFLTSADIASTGMSQVVKGKSQNIIGAMALSQATGVSLESAELLYGTLNLASSGNCDKQCD